MTNPKSSSSGGTKKSPRASSSQHNHHKTNPSPSSSNNNTPTSPPHKSPNNRIQAATISPTSSQNGDTSSLSSSGSHIVKTTIISPKKASSEHSGNPPSHSTAINYEKPYHYVCLSCGTIREEVIKSHLEALERSSGFLLVEKNVPSPDSTNPSAAAADRPASLDVSSPSHDDDYSQSFTPQDIAARQKFNLHKMHDRHVELQIPPNTNPQEFQIKDDTNICLHCYENLMQQLEEENEMEAKELKRYQQVRQSLLKTQLGADNDRDETGLTSQERKEIKKLTEELRQMEQKCNEAREELKKVKIESLEMSLKEESYWRTFFQTKERRRNTIQERTSMRRSLAMYKEYAEHAKYFSPKKFFRLWFDGSIATINELRLGSLPNQVTPWEEINAAWGLCALMLQMMAEWHGIFFSMYSIHPQGSTSFIEHTDTGKTYPLYFKNMRTVSDFNKAMEAYLYCLKEFSEHPLFQENRHYKYKNFNIGIEDHFIGGKNIHLATSKGWSRSEVKESDEWTRALKSVILTLKWLRSEIKVPSAKSTDSG